MLCLCLIVRWTLKEFSPSRELACIQTQKRVAEKLGDALNSESWRRERVVWPLLLYFSNRSLPDSCTILMHSSLDLAVCDEEGTMLFLESIKSLSSLDNRKFT